MEPDKAAFTLGQRAKIALTNHPTMLPDIKEIKEAIISGETLDTRQLTEYMKAALNAGPGHKGVIAAIKGVDYTDNPYVPSSDGRRIWLAGWVYGKRLKDNTPNTFVDDLMFLLENREFIDRDTPGWQMNDVSMILLEFATLSSRLLQDCPDWCKQQMSDIDPKTGLDRHGDDGSGHGS